MTLYDFVTFHFALFFFHLPSSIFLLPFALSAWMGYRHFGSGKDPDRKNSGCVLVKVKVNTHLTGLTKSHKFRTLGEIVFLGLYAPLFQASYIRTQSHTRNNTD